MSEVVIIYGSQVEKMVRQLIEETGALDRLRPDDLVMIKPNLVASRENWLGVDTDPRVIEALVKVLKRFQRFFFLIQLTFILRILQSEGFHIKWE